MANLNLSEFTEKTFVADADWTFVWDTAGLISKKVSRNNWLNSGTITTSAPVTISQTWNAVGQAFKALVVNAAGTSNANSASGSLLLDLQVGAVSQFSVNKVGVSSATGGYIVPGILQMSTLASYGFHMAKDYCVTWGGNATLNGSIEVSLCRDGAANTLALRNGAAAQTFNVYGTYTSGSAYSRLAIACDTSGNATLTTQSTGTAGTVSINGVPVGLGNGNVSSNVAIGSNSLISNTTGSSNLALGANALRLNTTATFNSALGENALRETTTGSFNVALGASAMQLNSTGASNTAVGVAAGAYAFNAGTSINNTTSSFSVFLGRDTKPDNIGQTNQIVIGYNANGLGSNSVVLGNASITTTALRGNVGIGTTAPSSKLQVSAGDVEVDTIAKGVILKSPDGTRYRVTVANGGTLSVAAV
jgi:hypothetical protein